MSDGAVRLLRPPMRSRSDAAILLVVLMLASLMTPLPQASAAVEIDSEDFGVVEQLHDVLDQRETLIADDGEAELADATMAVVRNAVRNSGSSDPLAEIDDALADTTFVDTIPVMPDHPPAYQMLMDPDGRPPGGVDNVWQTLLNITDYVVWTRYVDQQGQMVDKFEVVSFSSSLFSLFSPTPLTHSIDVDGDGRNDIETGLTISWDEDDGWGLAGSPPTELWVEPTIEFTVETTPARTDHVMWSEMQYLRVSLMKQFAYSSNPFVDGESYIWVIDTRFTNQPESFSLEVGLERFWFDITEASGQFLQTITLGLIFGSADESGIRIAAISAPYAIHIVNGGDSRQCRADYSPSVSKSDDPTQHGCGVTAGFGYLHLGPPIDDERPIWELAYIELSVHPHDDLLVLPRQVDLVIRTDSVLSSTIAVAGEGGLTSIEYHADEEADLHVHFFEDRSREPPTDPTEPYGNITESAGWLLGMPAGSMSEQEIERIFRMLGSESQPELPGQIPSQLGLIIAVKNFSRDSSPNANDSSLPVNPAHPPNSLILIRAKSSVESIEYTSWFLRQGAPEDYRRIDTKLHDLPTALVLYGSFDIGGGSDAQTNASLDDAQNLDFMSRMLDVTILNLVDLFIDIGQVLNSVPEAVGGTLTGGSGGGTGDGPLIGSEFHLELSDDWRVSRQPMAMGSLGVQLGSSSHPTLVGDHLLLGDDRDLDLVQGRRAAMGPLIPIGFSVRLSAISGANITNEPSTDTQQVALRLGVSQPLRVGFIEHDAGTIDGASFHMVEATPPPGLIALSIEGNDVTWNASSSIDEILYIGSDGDHRQAIRLREVPSNFSTSMSNGFDWYASSPIASLEMQISDAATPKSMDGDHFLYEHDPLTNSSSLSARLTNISRAQWMPPDDPDAMGEAGRATAAMSIDGNRSFTIAVQHPAVVDEETRGFTIHALINPLPAEIAFDIPATRSGDGPNLDVPEFNTTIGLRGIARFIDGFAGLGDSVNHILSELTETVTGRADEPPSAEFSYGISMDADRGFDLTIEATQGRLPLEAPDWHHGIGMVAAEVDNETGFHLRAWLPGLPPDLDASITFHNQSGQEQWDIRLNMAGWLPEREEFIAEIQGLEGQDLSLTLIGFTPHVPTSLSLDTTFTSESIGPITEVQISTHVEMSARLNAVHASLLDRRLGSKSELFVKEIPREIDLQATIGTEISVALSVPESERTSGRAVESVMLQSLQWSAGQWWPATIFLSDVPGTIDLDAAPTQSFDITSQTAFQGTTEFDFSASSSGMDLYMEVTGRAVNQRGDTVMMAEDLTDRMTISLTEDYGLAVRSGGSGIGRIYMRMSDMPVEPGVTVSQIEALGEDLKSATVDLHEVGGFYPVVIVGDVQGGRIIANARATIDIGGKTFDVRGVLLDAQTTSFIPTGTTFGVNGLASDLSILNVLPGFEGSTSHVMTPEPLTSGALTLAATMMGGGMRG